MISMGSESVDTNDKGCSRSESLNDRIINIAENIEPDLPHGRCIYKFPVNPRQVNQKVCTPTLSSDTNDKGFGGPESLYHGIINIPENIEPALPHGCCIYKVPVNLRRVNQKIYTPTLSSDTNDKGFGGPESLYHGIINIPENIEPALPHGCCIYKVPVNLRQVKQKVYTPTSSSVTNDKGFGGPESLYHRIKDIPGSIEPALPQGCCIYKVPVKLRQVNQEAYTPTLISIGPLHHGKEELAQMEKQKQRYFHFFWERLSKKEDLKQYEAYLRLNEQKIRSCYSERYVDNKKDFVDIILLDAVFVIELFLRNSNETKQEDDYLLTKPWMSRIIQRDLLLLENQLPIFVLKELYDTVVPEENKKGFLDLAQKYFESFDPSKSPDESVLTGDDGKSKRTSASGKLLPEYSDTQKHKENRKNWENSIHFTDLIRYFQLPKELGTPGPTPNVLRNAVKLHEAGINFEKVTDSCLLDIKFEKKPVFSYFLCLSCLPYFNWFKARFQIPQLKVDHTTECVLRNLIAFEQCHYPKDPYICNYVSLIDSLIHTTDDVDLLVETRVIVHELGSHQELATLVNGLCKHVVTDSTYYSQIITDLNQHYKNIWNRSMAALRLVYFRDPWRSSSTIVGIAIVIFTIFNFYRIFHVHF